jgi:hypothetical protein
MLFYVGKVMRHPAMANPTTVLLTYRNDLDDQLFDGSCSPPSRPRCCPGSPPWQAPGGTSSYGPGYGAR